MEELKHLTGPNDVLQLSKALQKIARAIEQQKEDPAKKESTIEELNFLKEQCLSNNAQLGLLASQTLYGLVENAILEPANVLTMFITMLSNANTANKISVIGEGIINILLLDLKIAILRLKSNESYVCPFGMKTAQHPIITLIHKKNINILDLANKLNGICNSSNQHIQMNSIEFLRPVFLHVLCNPVQISNAEYIWSIFLKQQKCNSAKTQTLMHEILAWSRITPERCLGLSIQLIDVIENRLETNNLPAALEYQVYLMAIVHSLIEYGYDPRGSLTAILRIVNKYHELDQEIVDFMLVSLSQIIHCISPFYLTNVLDILKVLCRKDRVANAILRNMVLDSLIIRLAINGKNIPPKTSADIERLIKELQNRTPSEPLSNMSENRSLKNVKYFHPKIAMNLNLVRLSAELTSDDKAKTLKRVVDVVRSNREFADEMHFFLRSIILSIDDLDSLDLWSDLLNELLASAKASPTMSSNTIYFILYLLAKETEGRKQLELLRGLTSFSGVKENIPLILNTYRSLSSSSSVVLRILSVDLHTRLWLAENRTYQFLHNVLIADDEKLSKSDKWDMNVVKANAIKEICSHKASQHGTDLVTPLSKILNNSADNDLSSSLALDAVVWLCKSHTVNIVSTWKVLHGVFESTLPLRTTKSLCEFFGEVPLLKSTSTEYDVLFDEALRRLWKFVLTADDIGLIRSALKALQNFEFSDLTLKHIPSEFYQNIRLPKEYQMIIAASHSDPDKAPLTAADVVPYIPGDCWIELLRNINENVVTDAIAFVSHLIETEMSQYRSGVYNLPEGRPEPKQLQHLNARSPLQSIVKFLIEQSEDKCEVPTVLKCLRCIAHKYSRPIPPLNWFFLIEYINQGAQFGGSSYEDQLDMKKYALLIAGNQIAHSGSAKSLVDNYLQSFDVSVKEPAEIQMALDLVPYICDGVTPRILATFLRSTLSSLYSLSDSSHFEDNCHFEVALQAISKTFDGKCLVSENLDIIMDEICKFNEVLDVQSKIFEKYATIVLKLPSDIFDRLSTPAEWTDDNFKKSLSLRSKAISAQKPFTTAANPWMWINLLIDNVLPTEGLPVSADDAERKELLLAQISDLLAEWKNERAVSEWIMFFLGKVQSTFSESASKEQTTNSLYVLDLFMYCIVIVTGCNTFISGDHSIKLRLRWLNKFPEALWFLTKRAGWVDHLPRLFEFLYHLKTQQSDLPKEYASILSNALICVKSNEYFLQKSTWSKFISLKKFEI